MESISRDLETVKKPISFTSRKLDSSKFHCKSHCSNPKCVSYFWQSVGHRDQKITLSSSVMEKPTFKMFPFHFSMCCDYNLFFPEHWPFNSLITAKNAGQPFRVLNGPFYNLIIYLFLFWLKDPYSNYVTYIPIKMLAICEQQEVTLLTALARFSLAN